MIIFEGKQFAAQKEQLIQKQLEVLSQETEKKPHVVSLVFTEDRGGIVYSREKQAVALRLGIPYEIVTASVADSIGEVLAQIDEWNLDPKVTGIIVQKPWKKTWEVSFPQTTVPTSFQDWWERITSSISIQKDIDGLHPTTLQLVKVGKWQAEHRALPATCRAVLSIVEEAEKRLQKPLQNLPALIVGRSELMGSPLFFELQHRDWEKVQLAGQKEFKELISRPEKLQEFATIVSSTGISNLITGDLVSEGCVVIDAGFPRGDVDFPSVSPKSAFITPVPNGVGPVTVISLLENAVDLCYNSSS